MIIYPAMDLIGGRVVRLKQGRFDDVTHLSGRPRGGACAHSPKPAPTGRMSSISTAPREGAGASTI